MTAALKWVESSIVLISHTGKSENFNIWGNPAIWGNYKGWFYWFIEVYEWIIWLEEVEAYDNSLIIVWSLLHIFVSHFASFSTQTSNLLPVWRGDKHLSGDHLERPHRLRLWWLWPAVDASGPTVCHQPIPHTHLRQPHPAGNVPWTDVQLQSTHRQRSHSVWGPTNIQPAHPQEHPHQ